MAKTQWLSADASGVADPAKMDAATSQTFLQLLAWAAEGLDADTLANRALAEACRWTATDGATIVAAATGQWAVRHQFGDPRAIARTGSLPVPLLAEVLDRASGALQQGEKDSPTLAAAPLERRAESGELLLVAASAAPRPDLLQRTVAFAQYLGLALRQARTNRDQAARIRRLEAVLNIAAQWNATQEVEPLLIRVAEEATRLLDADRASIFIWDRQNRQLVARPALGVEGGELRVPDDHGVVGQVVQTGRPCRVDRAYESKEFDKEVDRRLGYRTHNLVCVPLTGQQGDRLGAFEVLNKRQGAFTPEDEHTLTELAAQAAIALANAMDREQLVRAHRQLTDQAAEGVQIIGASPAIAALRSTIERLAGTDLPVLILGESGTGKEIVSRAIHFTSARRMRPFIAVNCAALAETLLESELFGHERGAFTDARETRQGKFELASGGTLFLDEIGDMSPGGQAKLLRVLEEKVVYRVGGSQPIATDVRVVAATNRKLADAVAQGKFRQDLFYRLSVVTLDLPPLRERPEDIVPLAEHFLEQFSRDARRKQPKLSAAAARQLESYPWPGNIRELKNLMERVAFLCPKPRLEPEDLALGAGAAVPNQADAVPANLPLADATDAFQRKHIEQAIQRAGRNMTDAAGLLGLHRANLYRKMRQLGMPTSD